MTKINKHPSTLSHLCKTYDLNVLKENSNEIFLKCLKPIKSLEKMLKKITGKEVVWQLDDEDFIADPKVTPVEKKPLTKAALEKIISSLIRVAVDSNASKVRLEPGEKDYHWRIYDYKGWHTMQYLPTNIGKQISDFIIKQSGLTSVNTPHHSHFKFKDHHFKCVLQPVWLGTVVQLDLVNKESYSDLDIVNFFNQPNFSNLIWINQRCNRKHFILPQQVEDLSKKHDVITVGDKIGLNEVSLNFPNTDEEINALLDKKPEIILINHHDLVNSVNLAKSLQNQNVKTFINITSYSPWPILSYLNNQKLNSNAIIITMTGEKVCEDCKKTLHPDIRIDQDKQVDHDKWLNNEVWENQTCNTTHHDHDFHVVVENWDGDVQSVHKKINEHVDGLILNGNLAWNSKNSFQQDRDNNYFNF